MALIGIGMLNGGFVVAMLGCGGVYTRRMLATRNILSYAKPPGHVPLVSKIGDVVSFTGLISTGAGVVLYGISLFK